MFNEGERRKRVAFERIETAYNKETGEVKEYSSVVEIPVKAEDHFCKDYYQNICKYKAWGGLPGNAISEIMLHVQGYNEDEDTPLYFVSDKDTRTQIAKKIGKSDRMVQIYIQQFVKNGFFFETNTRGKYICNPWFSGRGNYSKAIYKLRKHFKYINGKWECDLV